MQKGIDWYDSISLALGNRVRASVRARFREIEADPLRFGFAFDEVRFARVQRFPYLVLFRESDPFVVVLGVLHAASDPRRWRRRR